MAEAATVEGVTPTPVMQTSVAAYNPNADQVGFRFRRFTTLNNTAYQVGQVAGFPSHQAEELQRRGAGIVMHRQPISEREGVAGRMVRKGA